MTEVYEVIDELFLLPPPLEGHASPLDPKTAGQYAGFLSYPVELDEAAAVEFVDAPPEEFDF